MSFTCRLHDAFVQTNLSMAIMVLIEEKSSVSLADRLDEVVIKELHKNEHKNVALILRAMEHLISKDEDSIQKLVHHGLVVKMLNWFEISSEHLKEQYKPPRDAMNLIEVFYEVAMSLCQLTIAGSNKILDIFLLRFGAVVLDYEVPFCLRLEAIRTINSMLDSSPKDIRKKLCQSDDHVGLLENLAKALTDIGDYEMQVAISEALCRMTPRKLREDFADKWFSFRSFASAFTSIRDKDFETDCRTFLNELNSYFGNSRRVFSFPCIQAFLDSAELFKPEDEFLKEFWVDFNIGTSTISFFVNDPKNTLWELIHLPKDVVSMYDLQEHDDRKILEVHMSTPLSHGEITGKIVKIIFSAEHHIQTAMTKVFPDKPQSSSVSKEALQTGDWHQIEGNQHEQTSVLQTFTSPSAAETKVIHQRSPLSGPSKYSRSKVKGSPGHDIFQFKDHSDSEVARAKTVLFCQTSSNGSTKSLPDTLGRTPVKKKMKLMHSDECCLRKDTPHAVYSRRKPRAKGKLRVLPLSSPSSNEEELSKYSTPKERFRGKKRMASEDWQSQVKLGRSLNMDSSFKESTADSGFQNKTVSEISLPLEELDNLIEEHNLDKETSTPQKSEADELSELYVGLKGDMQLPKHPTFQPRRLMSSPLEDAAERVTEALADEESEEELGAGVKAVFNSFKTQLRAHFTSRYKKIEARSLQSLTDCQRNVTSLLGTVHNQRLVHLEQFQNTVVQQLACLEQDCLSLKTIEKETVNFWQSESDTVRAFCDRQQKRLDTLLIPHVSAEAPFSLSAKREAKITAILTVSQRSSPAHSVFWCVPVSALASEDSTAGLGCPLRPCACLPSTLCTSSVLTK
ncbi:synaptonemal complex protein 2-like isoform X3 [Onychostoma macrolepis]|uniref:synaptonemal complex protein 2-like isoform X3 n=1 Tax=Onychostoma macrolepis TaxID=369639 RepID=UPI00272ABB06|nr:synaptonemal complex protein 2-like isoform X3 [Onychostoma macrolepis]XP_058621198.1 synaptonemal complex protein 2-like isoform X3 [Onychostoma macrolepis]